jgi:uncharacterized protein (TIGR00730 family)
MSENKKETEKKSKLRRRERRSHLEDRLKILNRRAFAIEDRLKQLEDNRFYRVSIFGSARIKPDSEEYQEVYELARMLAWDNIDVLTGGGPGLMEAANRGLQHGKEERKTKSMSIGLSIELPWEPDANRHLDIKHHHLRFSSRLDQFMSMSNAVVCTPGGIGTILELYFTWQLVQVGHIKKMPIILMDKSYWEGLIEWMKNVPLERQLVSPKDIDPVLIVDTPDEVYEIISEDHKNYLGNKDLGS